MSKNLTTGRRISLMVTRYTRGQFELFLPRYKQSDRGSLLPMSTDERTGINPKVTLQVFAKSVFGLAINDLRLDTLADQPTAGDVAGAVVFGYALDETAANWKPPRKSGFVEEHAWWAVEALEARPNILEPSLHGWPTYLLRFYTTK